jgi:hypothetical protein
MAQGQGTELKAPVVIVGAQGQRLWELTEVEGQARVRLYGPGERLVAEAGVGPFGEAEFTLFHQNRPAAGLHATPHDGGVVTAYAPDGQPNAALLGTGRGVEVEGPDRRRDAA